MINCVQSSFPTQTCSESEHSSYAVMLSRVQAFRLGEMSAAECTALHHKISTS